MEVLIVGGTIGKGSSGVITKLHDELHKYPKRTITTFNGSVPSTIKGKDLICWFPDITNEEEKNYPIKDQGAVLICSKVMREGYSRIDAVSRIFKMHANAVVAITKIVGANWSMFEFELIDALNNTWAKTTSIPELVEAIQKLYVWTKGSVRKSLSHAGLKPNTFTAPIPLRIEEFIAINKALSMKAAEGCGNRYFGNFSTRCTKLFPSFKVSPTAYLFSPRNVDKRGVVHRDLVLTSNTHYWGDRKPSVDAPIQIELYQRYPEIDFMIHGHAYITNAHYTTHEYYPCGDLREVGEILNSLDSRHTRINLKNHGFLLVGKTVDNFWDHFEECEFKMIGGAV